MPESFLLFVTVGTSGLTNPEIGARLSDGPATKLLGAIAKYFKQDTRDEAEESALRGQLFDCHSHYWNETEAYRRSPKWFKQTSAELVSSARLLAVLRNEGHSVGRIVMLSSATDEGRMAAALNARLLKEHNTLKGLHNADVEHQEVPRLEAEFIEIVPAIDAIVQNKLSQSTVATGVEPRIIFNITGGFKGVIPSIVIAAFRHDAFLYYQHESRGTSYYVEFKDGKPKEGPRWTPVKIG